MPSVEIPAPLHLEEARFIKLRPKEKIPAEKNWQAEGGANYAYDDPALLAHLATGGNYGVLCGPGGICVLDADDAPRLKELVCNGSLPETFRVTSSPGKGHLYYRCPGLEKKRVLKDPDTGEHLGELQGPGTQVVGPGSVHPGGHQYTVIEPAHRRDVYQ